MALPQEQFSFTIEQYLELERAADERHEFIDGNIHLMAGESPNHSRINANLLASLVLQLRGKNCEAFSPNMKIRSGPYSKGQTSRKGMFSYADVSVVCGEPQFHDEVQDVLLNPIVLIEILSPSTETFDRIEKFRRYRTNISTLRDYVLVSSTTPLIQVFSLHSEGWVMNEAFELESAIRIPSIDCSLPLAEIYDRVEFPPPPEEPAPEGR